MRCESDNRLLEPEFIFDGNSTFKGLALRELNKMRVAEQALRLVHEKLPTNSLAEGSASALLTSLAELNEYVHRLDRPLGLMEAVRLGKLSRPGLSDAWASLAHHHNLRKKGINDVTSGLDNSRVACRVHWQQDCK
jgi:hypothetical protein